MPDAEYAKSIVWVTNYAPPYRRLVWDALAERFDLQVRLLESSNPSRLGRDNRGLDWSPPTNAGYSISQIRTLRVTRGEIILHFPLSMAIPIWPRPSAAVIGGWESPAYWQAILVCKLLRIRTVGFYESTLESNRFRRGPIAAARALFLRLLDAVVVPGSAAREAVLQYGVSPARVFEGFNAVDVVGIHERTALAREQLAVTKGHNFLYIGQLITRKNIKSLILAFYDVARSDDILTIIGAGKDEAALRGTVASLGMTAQVRFRGLVAYDDLPSVLAAHHTLVLPSEGEVWGLVVNEALAGGLHTVVSSRCGVAASVQMMDGVFISEPDPGSLSDALRMSRDQWMGPVGNPKILERTPLAFASTFAEALFGQAGDPRPSQPSPVRAYES